MRKICFVTGTRAEYGLLSRLMRLVADDKNCQLQIIATNMHLMPEYGETYREIEADGFSIDKKVYMSKSTDDAKGIVSSMAEEMIGMNDAITDLKPDIFVLLGDRYEILVAAEVALIHGIPIAHIHGGEVTEGAYDDAIRHSITKMSLLHFASTEEYRKRIIQMGEQPDRVYNVGSLGVENIKNIPLMNKQELEESIEYKFTDSTILVTYHPVTVGGDAKKEIGDFLSALEVCNLNSVIFTMPNSDNGRDEIVTAINKFVERHKNTSKAFVSLGMKRYLSCLQFVKFVAGNSSSGIIEVPSFHIPTLNIGSRQQGRIASKSVNNCGTGKDDIIDALRQIQTDGFNNIAKSSVNPYEKSYTAKMIFDVLKNFSLSGIQNKHFYDL